MILGLLAWAAYCATLAVAIWALIEFAPDTPEDDTYGIPEGDCFPVYPASHDIGGIR